MYKTKFPLFLLCLLFFSSAIAQKKPAKGFASLSRPEKCWVLAHPFVAKKAFRSSLKARAAADSLGKSGAMTGANGGQLDAFRHAYWMALLVQDMSAKKALKLGRAHEKGNYLGWKKNKSEEGRRADSLSCVMDLRNNEIGALIGKNCSSVNALVDSVKFAVWNGRLTILKKDAEGNLLDCQGNMVDITLYDRKWYMPLCLVKSNEIVEKH